MSTFKDRSPFVKARPSNQPFARAAAPYPRANHIASITKTLLRAVRLTGIVILIACLHASAGINAQDRISINMKSAPLEKVFAEIELRSGYTVFYNTEVLKYSGPITVEMKDAMVADVMRHVLRGLPLEFNIQDKTIFVKHVKPAAAVAGDPEGPGKNGATPSTVSGIVQTEAGQPLVGATVYIKRLKKMAVTDAKGEVSWKDVPDGEYDVEVSYVGFEKLTTKITVVNHEAVFTAALKEMMNKLDETVVKGYYNTTNRLNTGDVTTVKGEDIQKQPVSDPVLALEGRVPGLYIQQASGLPGAYSVIHIMGLNSIANGNNPLYIIDGVPYSSNTLTSFAIGQGALGVPSDYNNTFGFGASPFNYLDPANIESIEVLKDADATAIYGSRGANGVILITTKKGKAGHTQFDLNAFAGAGKVARRLKMLNTPQYLEMRHEAFQNDGQTPGFWDFDVNGTWDTTHYTDWQKELIGRSSQFSGIEGDLSGGNANTQFLIGGGYNYQGTVFPGNSSDKKASAHVNLTHVSADQRLHMMLNSNYVVDNNNVANTDLTSQINMAPSAPALYNKDGTINWEMANGSSTYNNPLAYVLQPCYAVTTNLISNLNLSYGILPGLQIRSSFGYSNTEMNQSNQVPGTSWPAPLNINPSNRTNATATTNFITWIIEPQIDYKKKILQGQLEALVGSTFEENTQNSSASRAIGFASDALIPDPLAASTYRLLKYTSTLYHYDAVFGRLSYTWDEKYLINFTARRDGSSRFGPGKQFGNFGAVGAAWIFSKEKFVQNGLPFLSFGKVRASYGTTGNDQITDYQFLSTYTPYSPTYEGITGLYPTRIPNPNFGWEEVKKMEGGIELGFIEDKIILSASYYRNRTGNQLVGFPLPYITGGANIQANLPAIVQNTGIEIVLNTIDVKSRNFTWNTTINVTIPRNKLVAYPNLATSPYAHTYAIGRSLFVKPVFHYLGVNDSTGVYEFSSSKGTPSSFPSSPADYTFSKPLTQSFYGGVLNSLTFKGLQLDIFVQFVKQLGINYFGQSNYSVGQFNVNYPTQVLARWQKPGDITKYGAYSQNFNADPAQVLNSSDFAVQNASFIRLKNLAISYQLPPYLQKAVHLQNARIYLQCQNLITITKFLGLDPETGGSLVLPPLRMITGGMKLGF